MFELFKHVFHTSEQETIKIFEEKINVKYEDELCSSFRVLSLTDSKLSDLSPLSSFVNLEILNLSNNNIFNINALKKLKKLKIIDLRFNQLKELPEWIFELKKPLYWERNSEEEEGIFLEGNPLSKNFLTHVKKRSEEDVLEQLYALNTQHLALCIPQSLKSGFLEEFVPDNGFFIYDATNFRLNLSVIKYDKNEISSLDQNIFKEFKYMLLFLVEKEDGSYHEQLDFFMKKCPNSQFFLVIESAEAENHEQMNLLKIDKYKDDCIEIFYRYNISNGVEIRDKICNFLQNTKEAKSLWRKSWIELKNELEEMNEDSALSLNTFHEKSQKYRLPLELEEELLSYFIKIGSLRLKKEEG
jgi:hypothetical protein